MSKTNAKLNQIVEVDEGKSALIRGIEDDAKKEASEILAQAEKAREERIIARDKQVQTILDEAKKKAQEQSAFIAKNTASLVSVDTKRKMLKLREQVIARITGDVEKKMEALVSSPEYAGVLKNWIIEAAIGLATSHGDVNSSAKEKPKITSALLREAEAEAERLSGRKVSLSISGASPLSSQGITITAADGKTAFNNQVHTRLIRHQSEIRKLIYHELFGE